MEGEVSPDGMASRATANGRRTRQLQAILAADVVGYSRLMNRDEEGTLARLQALEREVVDPRIDEFGGEVVKRMGDGILASFPSAVDALRAARAIQEAVAERNDTAPGSEPIRYRIGLNVGDVIVTDGDIFGDGVNIAARLEGIAEPGGITLSAAVHDNVRAQISGPFDDLGEQRLKNIDHPVRVYRLRLDGSPPLAATEAAGASVTPRRLLVGTGLLLAAALTAWAWWPDATVERPVVKGLEPVPERPVEPPEEPVVVAPVVRVEPVSAPAPAPEPARTAAWREAPAAASPPPEPAVTEKSAPADDPVESDFSERLLGSIIDAVEKELTGNSSVKAPGKSKTPPGKAKGKKKNK